MQATSYGLIVYGMIGFEWTVDKFFWYLFFSYFTLLYFTYFGMMTVGISPNQHIATLIATAFYTIWNLFSGFIVPRTVSSIATPSILIILLILFFNTSVRPDLWTSS